MRRKIMFSALLLALSGGVAMADGGRVRDHRGGVSVGAGHGIRNHGPSGSVRARADGRFHFPGGATRTYRRPAFTTQHRDYYQRPARVVESYQSMQGYVWVPGDWQWNGYQWMWTDGYYAPASNSYPTTTYGPGYPSPSYSSPSYSSPSYTSPSYTSPSYSSPSYSSPSYSSPSYAPSSPPCDGYNCTDPTHVH